MPKINLTAPERVAGYLAKGYWEESTLADFWDRHAEESPDKVGLVDVSQGKRFTWAQLKEITDRLALGLIDMGIARDEVVIGQLPNWAENVTAHMACDKAGILYLGPRTNMRQSEMEHFLKITGAPAVIIPGNFRGFDHYESMKEIQSGMPQLKHIIVTGPDIPAGALSLEDVLTRPLAGSYPPDHLSKTRIRHDEIGNLASTTGTTGAPKVAAHSEGCLVSLSQAVVSRLRITADDAILSLVPFWSGINLLVSLAVCRVGCTQVVMENFEPGDILKVIEKERVTVTCSAPAIYFRMIGHPDLARHDLSSLRMAVSAGGPLPPELAVKIEEALSCKVSNVYGAVDGGTFGLGDPDAPPEVRFTTVGRAPEGTEVKLVDGDDNEVPTGQIGEVVSRGPLLYEGYFHDPERTREVYDAEGWYHTGDLGWVDAGGTLTLVGRKKEVIIRGGQNIYPAEVEGLLMEHPDVASVAIVAMPDPEMGEKCCAFVIPQAGEKIPFGDMVSFLKEKKIASFKIPERLEFVDQFPLAGEAKVNKRELQDMLAQRMEAEGEAGPGSA
ncbi:MAG: AMP-binding protein [Dehalococcoidia bacterium]